MQPIVLQPSRLPHLIRSLCLLIALSGVTLFLACHEPIVIPDMPTAQEQYAIALQQYQDFCNPIMAHRKEQRDEIASRALAAFTNVITRFPAEKQEVAWSEYRIADIHKRLGKSKQSLEEFDLLSMKYPDNEDVAVSALMEAGDLSDDLGKHEKAKVYYNEAIKQFGASKKESTQKIIQYCATRYRKVWGKKITPVATPRKDVK
ncbi:TPA: hypothetical protein DDW35_11100 [Candidatus Sumerlaeota bacterium]|jgi:tetratricopeptide (TPR) repeat protein|nr:hypothetical protein [Candidatus Sumerlaeota bacterium]